MNILLITELLRPEIGGVENFLHSICRFTKAKVRVLTVRMRGDREFDCMQSYPIRRLSFPRGLGFVTFFLNALFMMVRTKTEIIFVGHLTTLVAVAWLLKVIFRVPLVLLFHGRDLEYGLSAGRFSRLIALFALRRCDLVLTNSRYNKERYADLLGPDRVNILHPGVDTELFQPGVDCTAVEERYHLKGRRALLTVGRLVAIKNQEAILKVLPKIIQAVPDVVYVIVGDGPEHSRLRWLTRELGISDYVVFTGTCVGETLVQLYNACRVCVMISKPLPMQTGKYIAIHRETFGISFVEANACGKPVIGANMGGIPDAVIHGETGYLVDPNNPEELEAAILDLLLHPEKAEAMGKKGRERVVGELTWQHVVERFERKLWELLYIKREKSLV